jgi:hypothetical protein
VFIDRVNLVQHVFYSMLVVYILQLCALLHYALLVQYIFCMYNNI